MKVNAKRWLLLSGGLLVVLLFSAVISLLSGEELDIGFSEAFSILFGGGDPESVEYMLIRQVRMPRILLGIAVGGSLSLSGLILQGIYRNPLVEPFTLGISGGASLGVALVIVLGLHHIVGEFILPASGFLGALLVVVIVYILGAGRGRIDVTRMLLTGVMVSFVASSAMMLLMSLSNANDLQGIIFWTMGSLDEPDQMLINLSMVVAVAGLIISYMFVKPLNAMRLGEDKAMHLGINTNTSVKILFLLASLMSGVSVAVAGVIGFVGLIVPHFLRMIFGSDYRILLVSSFFVGGVFLVLSDILARTILLPNELPIGVITGIIGGTIFILIMNRKK